MLRTYERRGLEVRGRMDLWWLGAIRTEVCARAAPTYEERDGTHGHNGCGEAPRLLGRGGSVDPGARSWLAGRARAPADAGCSQLGCGRGARERARLAQRARLRRSPAACAVVDAASSRARRH